MAWVRVGSPSQCPYSTLPCQDPSEGDPVEREADRQAFARARTYLNYHAVAKWSALLAAVGTGVLSVALLIVLWLFAELIVHHGRIPEIAQLGAAAREDFVDQLGTFSGEQKDGVRKKLEAFGVPEKQAGAIVTKEGNNLNDEDQALLWRAHLHDLFSERVSEEAAAIVVE